MEWRCTFLAITFGFKDAGISDFTSSLPCVTAFDEPATDDGATNGDFYLDSCSLAVELLAITYAGGLMCATLFGLASNFLSMS